MSVLDERGLGCGRAPAAALAANRLGVLGVVFIVMGAMAPLTTVAGALPTAYAVTGITGIPIAFVLVGLLLGVFSVGYCAMARRIEHSGALYAYITAGLGRPAGLAAALIALVSYAAFVAASLGGLGAAVRNLVQSSTGSAWPWWAYALIGWAAAAFLGLLRVDVSSTILGVLMLAEVIVVLVLIGVYLAHPAGGHVSAATWSPARLLDPGAAPLAIVAVTAFVGFETSAVWSEEVRDRTRTVLLATFTTIGVVTVLYSVAAWAMTVAAGTTTMPAYAGQHGADTIFSLAQGHVPGALVVAGRALFATGVFAALLAFQAPVARYVFALGREHVLPARLGRVHPATGATINASLAVSAFGLAVIVLAKVLGWDPLVNLFFYGGSLGGFGILVLLVAVSIAVTRFLPASGPDRENAGTRLVAPLIATAALGVVAYLALRHFDVLLGVAPGNGLRWQLPALFLVAAVIGVVWAVILRARRPEVYRGLGLGPNAALTTPATTNGGVR